MLIAILFRSMVRLKAIGAPFILTFLLLALLAGGCRSAPSLLTAPTTRPGGVLLPSVQALCYPPADWKAEPLKQSGKHEHQIWLSPDGSTAYGVIHFSLPWPVGPDMTLWGFLREMKRSEGSAELIWKKSDESLPGLRFEAKGQIYHLWGNLITDGWHGWATYAGTVVNRPVHNDDLKKAEQARERTVVDRR